MKLIRKSIIFFIYFIIITGILEITSCNILNHRKAPSTIIITPFEEDFFISDIKLGYKARNNHTVHVRQLSNRDSLIYAASYSTDSLGRRIALFNDTTRSEYAIFFGGSFVFGDGLEDSETLPNCLAQKSDAFNVYNYAFSGYGPQQVYALTDCIKIREEIREKEGIAFYIFMDDHIFRTIGDRNTMDWGSRFPRYVKNDSDIVIKGTLAKNSMLVESFIKRINKSYLLTVLNIDLVRILLSKAAIKNTIDLIEASRNNYKSAFGNDNFYVVLYPGSQVNIRPMLESKKIKTIDFSGDSYESIHDLDFHPTHSANRHLAEKILAFLHLENGTRGL